MFLHGFMSILGLSALGKISALARCPSALVLRFARTALRPPQPIGSVPLFNAVTFMASQILQYYNLVYVVLNENIIFNAQKNQFIYENE